ncbi:MAG: hypothetical protein OXE94_04795 [Aestuariivita sp.]|nr:hypothetical protein [Aestuariivita sp.]
MFILLKTAEITFIDFIWAGKLRVFTRVKPLPDTLHKKPRRWLPNTKLAVNLHAGSHFDARRHHVNSNRPFLQANLARLHGCSMFHGEMAPAVAAAIGHRLAVLFFARIG